jgi:hypothetical protein
MVPVILKVLILFIILRWIFRSFRVKTDDAQYSAHWPGTILLFAIAMDKRRK